MANNTGGTGNKEVKLPSFGLPKRPSMFSGGIILNNSKFSGKKVVLPQVRITQNKGGGGK